MTWVRNQRVIRLWLVAFYALSMALVGFTHAAPPSAAKIDLAAYVLPDGSLPTICLNTGDTGGTPQMGSTPCDACLLISASGLLPCRADVPTTHPVVADVTFEPAADFTSVTRFTHVPHLRGPPQAFAVI